MKFSSKFVLIFILLAICLDLLGSVLLSFKADNEIATYFNRSSIFTSIISLHDLPNKYNFYCTQADFLVLSFLRVAILCGGLIGVLYNRTKGQLRVNSVSPLCFFVFLIALVYSPVKLLALSELADEFRFPYFWTLFGFNIFISVISGLIWNYVLTNVKAASTDNGHTVVSVDPPPDTINGGSVLNENDNAALLENEELGGVLVESSVNCKKSEETPTTDKEKAKKDEPKISLSQGRSAILRLLRYCKNEWMWYLLGFVFLIFYSGARLFIPYYTGQVVSDVVITRSYEKLLNSVILMASFALASAIFAGFRGACFTYAIAKVGINIRSHLFLSLMKQDIGFYDVTKSGDITSRLTSDCQTMAYTVGLNVNVFLRSFILFLGSLIVMVKISWQLTLMMFIALPVLSFISHLYGKYFEKLSEKTQDSLAQANVVAEEVLTTMRTVRSFANELGESRRFDEKLDAVMKINKKYALAILGYHWINELFVLLLQIAVLWYGGHLVLSGRMSSEGLISYLLYQIQLGDTMSAMSFVYTGLMQAAGAAHKVFELIDRKPAIPNDGQFRPETIEGRIEFRNVTFNYPSRPSAKVLKDVSFTINPGEIAALVGPSGGGKSSCISLLEHFYEPLSGDILLDGVSVKSYDHAYFHRVISLVGQEPILYARPVSENIAYGLSVEEFTENDVISASKMANAHDFVVSLPSGYKTDVGEKGVQISGGQKQRVAIARALIRKPKVLLLDEATSALDAESEFLVQQALYNNFAGHTVLLIAHRLSTVEKADRIIVVDNGVVVQEGSHKKLLEMDGLYKNLVHRQLLGKVEKPSIPSTDK